jgi:hypothetical protein
MVAHVGDELVEWRCRVLPGLGLVLWGPRLLVFVDAFGISHNWRGYGRAFLARKGRSTILS